MIELYVGIGITLFLAVYLVMFGESFLCKLKYAMAWGVLWPILLILWLMRWVSEQQ